MRYRFNSLLLSAGLTVLLTGCVHLQTKTSQSISAKPEANNAAQQANNGQTIMNGNSTTDAVPLATLSTAKALQDLIAQQRVTELRTSYNATYGTSLLFHAGELDYYVALFQRNDFWRVIKTKDALKAEQTYLIFSENTRQLAQTDIERTRLRAEQRFMEKQLAMRSTELSSLQSDLAIQRQHERAIAAYQQRTKEEATRLNQQQRNIQTQLRALQHQIDALELQKNQVDQEIELQLNN